MKFEIGDKVKIVTIKDIEEPEQGDYPIRFLNEIGTIRKVYEDGYPYLIEFDNKDIMDTSMCWHELNLELVYSEPNAKDEVIDAISWLLTYGLDTNEYTVPNGSTWTHEELIKYIKENLK